MNDSDAIAKALEKAQVEVAVRDARIEGLELLASRFEALGREAVAKLAGLLAELGVDVDHNAIPPARLPELVDALMDNLGPARHQVGLLAEELERRAAEVRALLAERDDLRARLAAHEGGGASRSSGERERLRVLMVLHDFLPRHRGGTEVYAWRLSKALAARNDVQLFFTEAHPDTPSYRVREGRFDDLAFTEVSHQHVAESFEESWRDEHIEAIFGDVLARFRPDVVHVHHLAHLSLGLIARARAFGAAIVYTLHDFALLCPREGRMLRADFERCEQPVPERCVECLGARPIRARTEGLAAWFVPEGVRRFVRAVVPVQPRRDPARDAIAAVEERLAAARSALSVVDLVVAPSRWLAHTFTANGMVDATRVVVSENGQDVAPFRAAPRRKGTGLRVGYIGAIVPAKGVHVLIDAMRLLEDLPDVVARIHGVSDADSAYAAGLAASPPRNVAFAGDYAPGEAAQVLAGLDVLVVPSLWWENSPLTIQEAFLAGIPVVVSGIGGMAEKVVDGVDGLHFPPGDAVALATRLRQLHDDPALLVRLSAGRPIVKTIAEDAADLEARYRAIPARAPSPAR